MSCLSPNIYSPRKDANPSKTGKADLNEVQAARRGLLKAMWSAAVAPRFSSKPIAMEDYFSPVSFASHGQEGDGDGDDASMNNSMAAAATNNNATTAGKGHSIGRSRNDNSIRGSLVASKTLTTSEQVFLEQLLQSEDLDSIRKASQRLADKDLFPTTTTSASASAMVEDAPATSTLTSPSPGARSVSTSGRSSKRRDSEVQQELYRLHETGTKPSTVLRRMSDVEKSKDQRQSSSSSSSSSLPPLSRRPSASVTPPESAPVAASADEKEGAWDMNSDHEDHNDDDDNDDDHDDDDDDDNQDPSTTNDDTAAPPSPPWNPFGDVNSWIDGNQGVEVDGDGVPSMPSPTSNPFKILGTSADDVSAHPHVLTPPLMEGLQAFMPESLHEYHFWLKYSLVRDGPAHPSMSPAASLSLSSSTPLSDMVRHGRASPYTVLAIETTDGHVFGAFCSHPWRLLSTFGGSKDSFVWRMRRSRKDPCDSIVDQVLMESKMEVFPYTGRNTKVQRCSVGDDGASSLELGEGELKDEEEDAEGDSPPTTRTTTTPTNATTPSTTKKEGEHFGNAIRLDAGLTTAWTSTSETFANPCLVHTHLRGEQIEIANVELWALTPHTSLESAITLEMNQLFLAERQGPHEANLNLFEILVGGPV